MRILSFPKYVRLECLERNPLTLSIAPYPSLSSKLPTGEQLPILASLNMFLNTFNNSSQQLLMDMYRDINSHILSMTTKNAADVKIKIREILSTTFNTVDFIRSNMTFCRSGVWSYPDLRKAGIRAEHTPEDTFYLEDYQDLTAMSIVSKLIAPLWGALYDQLEHLDFSVEESDEFSLDIVSPVLDSPDFEFVCTKLTRLVTRITNAELRRFGLDEINELLHINGLDRRALEKLTFYDVVVRALVNYDPFPDAKAEQFPNVVIYLNNVVKNRLQRRLKALRKS